MSKKTLCLLLLASAAVFVCMGGAQASHTLGHLPPATCPSDVVVNHPAYVLNTARGVERPGSWRVYTTTNGAEWVTAKMETPIVAITGGAGGSSCDAVYGGQFRIQTFTEHGGQGVTYSMKPQEPEDPSSLTQWVSQNPTVTAYATGDGIQTVYSINNAKDRLRITYDVSLHGVGSADTFIHIGFQVCHTGPGDIGIALQSMANIQTGTDLTMNHQPRDEWAAVMSPWSNGAKLMQSGTPGYDLDYVSGVMFSKNVTMTEMNLYALLQEQANGTIRVPYPINMRPDHFAVANWPAISGAFGPPAGGGAMSDGAIAWYWGKDASDAIILGGQGTEGTGGPPPCFEAHGYLAGDHGALMEELPIPPNEAPEAIIDVDASYTSCEDSQVRFSAERSFDRPYVGAAFTTSPDLIHWDFGDGTTIPPAGMGLAEDFQDYDNLTHQYDAPGSYLVKLIVYDVDSEQGQNTTTVVSVGDPNCGSTMQPVGQQQAQKGVEMQVPLASSDFEGDRRTYTVPDGPVGMLVRSNTDGTGLIRYIPPADGPAEFTVMVCVADSFSPPDCVPMVVIVGEGNAGAPARDRDDDGVADDVDNCYLISNRDQRDTDGDGVGDACDPPDPYEPPTSSSKPPGPGDPVLRCDPVLDGDLDGDGIADPCDLDIDNDGIVERGAGLGLGDNCPFVSNPTQKDTDGDGIGDACDGTVGLGYPVLALQGQPCIGCPDAGAAPADASPSHVQGSDIGLMFLGAGVTLAVLGVVVGIIVLQRRL